MSNLKDRAVLVKFTDHRWLGGTRDQVVSSEVEVSKGAKEGTGHYWKRLVPRVALAERSALGGLARVVHDRNTLPWLGGGVRILPAANFQEYMTKMRAFKTQADALVEKFCTEYNTWIDEAKRTQGKLFNQADYPSLAEIKSKFGFDVDVMPLPNIADWRVDLTDDQIKEIRVEAEKKLTELHKEGVIELFKRLTYFLERAHKQLSDKDATFRDSLIGNIKDMVGLMARLNVSNDPQIEEIRKETEEKLAGLGPITLRDNPVARSKAASDAASIIAKMSSYMGGTKIVLPTPVAAKPKAKKGESKPKAKVKAKSKAKPAKRAEAEQPAASA